MRIVKVFREALLVELKKNKAAHTAIYEQAFKAYSAAAVEALTHALLEAKTGRGIQLAFNLPVPTDHTEDYDRAIKMAEMSVDDAVELDEAEFSQFVMDQWGWKRNWSLTNTTYGINQ